MGVNEFHRLDDKQRNEIIKRLDRIVELFEKLADKQTLEPEPPPPPTPISAAASRRPKAAKRGNAKP